MNIQIISYESRRLFAVKKALSFLLLLLCICAAMPALALEYAFISDLSQHVNKHFNILMPDAKGYQLIATEQDLLEYDLALLPPSSQQPTDTLPSEATLYFWHPRGVIRDSIDAYSFTITHTASDGFSKTYSTADGTITASQQHGIAIKTNRLGKFSISFTAPDYLGLPWSDFMDELEFLGDNESFILDDIKVSRSGNTTTFKGLIDGRRIRTDAELYPVRYSLPGQHFIFDNVELREVKIHPVADENWTIHLTDSVTISRGVEVWIKSPVARIHLINDTKICDLNPALTQRDYPLTVDVPYGASFHLTGKGSIPRDYCRFSSAALNNIFTEKKSMLLNVYVAAGSTEEAIPKFAKVFSDIHLDQNQFPSKDLSACIRTCLVNKNPNGDSYEVVYQDHPAANHFSELNENQVNLILPGADNAADMTLQVGIHEHSGDRSITYDLALLNTRTQTTASISSGAYLYLPYPEGINADTAAQYDFTITHYTGYKTETFSTRDGSIERMPEGLRILIHSMSPFVLSWEDAPPAAQTLPRTGDDTHLGLWFALLALTGASALLLKRKAA